MMAPLLRHPYVLQKLPLLVSACPQPAILSVLPPFRIPPTPQKAPVSHYIQVQDMFTSHKIASWNVRAWGFFSEGT